MRDSLTKCQFITSLIINGINTLIAIAILSLIFINPKIIFMFLTMWTYYMNSIYLCINLICDFNLYIKKSNKLEKLNDWNRNTYSQICNTFTYLVFILFWSLILLGKDFMNFGKFNLFGIIINVYLHFLITVFCIIDIIIQEHNKITFKSKNFVIIIIIFTLYMILCVIGKYILDFCPYTFIENGNIKQLIVAMFIFYIIVYNCYCFHIWIINKFNNDRNSINSLMNKEEIDEKENNTNNNDNTNIKLV